MVNWLDIWLLLIYESKIANKKVLNIIKKKFHMCIYLLISVSNSWINIYGISK